MATATVGKVVRTKVVLVDEKLVTLKLNEEEAQVLADLSAAVGGPAAATRRGLVDDISLAFRAAGIHAKFARDLKGAAYFV